MTLIIYDFETSGRSPRFDQILQAGIIIYDENLRQVNLIFRSGKKYEAAEADQNMNFLNFNEDKKNLMYIFENDKVKVKLFKEIKKQKIKTLKKNINNLKDLSGYDLKILCLGRSSKIYQNIIDKRSLDKDYKEVAITGYVKHSLKNINTAQYFLLFYYL